jgi:coproporphyrinogen III oxidase-like Fe-S oxidoreductase
LYAIQNRCGFNRVSLGVQSMDDEILKVMGRQHTVQDVYDSMIMLREANITSISIDLICGQVPGLTLSKKGGLYLTNGTKEPQRNMMAS